MRRSWLPDRDPRSELQLFRRALGAVGLRMESGEGEIFFRGFGILRVDFLGASFLCESLSQSRWTISNPVYYFEGKR